MSIGVCLCAQEVWPAEGRKACCFEDKLKDCLFPRAIFCRNTCRRSRELSPFGRDWVGHEQTPSEWVIIQNELVENRTVYGASAELQLRTEEGYA